MTKPLQGKRVLVTGASRGLGRGFATLFAGAGASVVVHARELTHLRDVIDELPGVAAAAGDLSSDTDVVGVARAATQAFGGIDILVNNAGIGVRGLLLEADLIAWKNAFAVNVLAAMVLARELTPGMIQRGWGRVINVSSPYARVPSPGLSAYCTTKAAVDMLTKAMALEWAGTGVTANAIAPVQVLTDLTRPSFEDPERRRLVDSQIPLGRWARPEDLDGAMLLLASPGSDMMTGQTLFIDGGRLLL